MSDVPFHFSFANIPGHITRPVWNCCPMFELFCMLWGANDTHNALLFYLACFVAGRVLNTQATPSQMARVL